MTRKQFLKLLGAMSAVIVVAAYRPFTRHARAHSTDADKLETGERIQVHVKRFEEEYGLASGEDAIIIDPSRQELYLIRDQGVIKTYLVSTSRFGLGNVDKSYKTPPGVHRIREKIGHNAERGAVFVGRVNTGRPATIETRRPRSGSLRRSITTRILWLDGQESGINKGRNKKGQVVDSYDRYIYIHGTSAEWMIGRPDSIGCILMKNDDVIELFDLVPEGTLVKILNKEYKR